MKKGEEDKQGVLQGAMPRDKIKSENVYTPISTAEENSNLWNTSEPVVGYLIAIEGAYFGEGFKLKTGRNFIGRSPEMDIQLSLDLSVSRRKHAIIIYEPRARIFIAQPGESRELFYLNDQVVLNNVTMKPYDILTIGETKLLLLPLCGENFTWDDYKK